jgi:hypothetical protein
MDGDIPIVRITQQSDIMKHPARYRAGNEWSFKVEYTLEDGRTFPGTKHFRRLKDAKEELAHYPVEPNNHFAIFHGDKFAGVSIVYGMITAWPTHTLS